jgi:acyl-CoA thioester hydrolase
LKTTISDSSLPFCWKLRVYYEDTDAGGVVYYTNYLKFMERARSEWLRSLGFDQRALTADPGVVFAVRNVNVEFIRPARLDDQLTVTAELVEMRSASLILDQAVYRGPPETGELLARGDVKVACLEVGSFRPTAVPRHIKQVLQSARRS